MVETQRVAVDEELYVNEATLDYLRRRIEGEVKGNFFRWIGLPVGGVGLLTIVLTLFLWIPEKIETIIETNPVIQKTLDRSTIEYLNDPQRGQQFINNQLEADIESYFRDPNRGRRLINDLIEKTASTQIETITQEFFQSEGEPLIRNLAETYLKSPEVRELLIKAIDTALAPKIASLSTMIQENTDKLVVEVAQASKDTKRIDKGTMDAIFDFLNSAEAQTIKDNNRPVALTLTVRRGHFYDEHAVVEYINLLSDFFGPAFDSILVLDSDGTFMARLQPAFVKNEVMPLMHLFNSNSDVSRLKIKEQLEHMQGAFCTATVQSRLKVFEALTSSVWHGAPGMQTEVPVLNDQGVFIGLTSRTRLIEGILG